MSIPKFVSAIANRYNNKDSVALITAISESLDLTGLVLVQTFGTLFLVWTAVALALPPERPTF